VFVAQEESPRALYLLPAPRAHILLRATARAVLAHLGPPQLRVRQVAHRFKGKVALPVSFPLLECLVRIARRVSLVRMRHHRVQRSALNAPRGPLGGVQARLRNSCAAAALRATSGRRRGPRPACSVRLERPRRRAPSAAPPPKFLTCVPTEISCQATRWCLQMGLLSCVQIRCCSLQLFSHKLQARQPGPKTCA